MVTMTTKIINILGPPCSGKSTLACGLFYELKKQHYSVELVTEKAKDVTYERSISKLHCQPYIFGQQLWRVERLVGKVDYVITDSPIILSVIYSYGLWGNSFDKSVIEIFKRFDNINFLLENNVKYSEVGRNETKEEANLIGDKIRTLLNTQNIKHDIVSVFNMSKILDRIHKLELEKKNG